MAEKGEREKEIKGERVLLKKGFGIGHKSDCWSNFSELRDGYST
jgi:hypothetical protein